MSAFNSFPGHSGATTVVSAPVAGFDVGADAESVACEINITVAGTTGTYGLEASLDGTNWFQVLTVPSDTEVAALTQTYTTTGRRLLFFKNDLGKFWRLYRVTPTVVTGQTYSSTLFSWDRD